MFAIQGLSTSQTLTLLEKTKPKQIESIEKSAMHSRAIEKFREKVGDVVSIDDLFHKDNYEAYTFLMKAHGLEDKIYAKAMMKEVFASDPDDKTSLLNRLNDPKLKAIHESLGFRDNGMNNYNTFSSKWQEEMVDMYVEEQFVQQQEEANPAVGVVLRARESLSEVKSWFGVLASEDLSEFMRTALQIPQEVIFGDIDKQKALFEKKYDFAKLKDPEEVEKLVKRYTIFSDMNNAGSQVDSPILTLMGMGPGGFAGATYDIAAMSSFRPSAYR
jgi:hypothetical protein